MPYGGNPSTSDTDATRLLVGDTSTSSTGVILSDTEHQYFIDTEGTIYGAAAAASKAIAAKFADEVTKAVGDLRISLSDKAERYQDLSKELARRGRILAEPVMPARSKDAKQSAIDDTDRVAPLFARGDFTHPEAISNDRSTST